MKTHSDNEFDDLGSMLNHLQAKGVAPAQASTMAPIIFTFQLFGDPIMHGWLITPLMAHPDNANFETLDLDLAQWANASLRTDQGRQGIYIDREYATSLPDHKLDAQPYPIIVLLGDKHIVIDGNHRLFAAYTRGRKTLKASFIPAEIVAQFKIPQDIVPFLSTDGRPVDLDRAPPMVADYLAGLPDYAFPGGKNTVRAKPI